MNWLDNEGFVEDIPQSFKSDMKDNIAWYVKHRTKIWGAIWFIAGLVGGNTDRLYSELSKPLSTDSRIETLNEDLEILEGRVLQLELDKGYKEFNFDSRGMTI